MVNKYAAKVIGVNVQQKFVVKKKIELFQNNYFTIVL